MADCHKQCILTFSSLRRKPSACGDPVLGDTAALSTLLREVIRPRGAAFLPTHASPFLSAGDPAYEPCVSSGTLCDRNGRRLVPCESQSHQRGVRPGTSPTQVGKDKDEAVCEVEEQWEASSACACSQPTQANTETSLQIRAQV